jgi:chitodextrinase
LWQYFRAVAQTISPLMVGAAPTRCRVLAATILVLAGAAASPSAAAQSRTEALPLDLWAVEVDSTMAENMSAEFFRWLGAYGINALVVDRGRVNEAKRRRIERLASEAKLPVLIPARPRGLQGKSTETAAPDAAIARACRQAGLRTCMVFVPSVAAALRVSAGSAARFVVVRLRSPSEVAELHSAVSRRRQQGGSDDTSPKRIAALIDLGFEPVFDSTSWRDAIGRAQSDERLDLAVEPALSHRSTALSLFLTLFAKSGVDNAPLGEPPQNPPQSPSEPPASPSERPASPGTPGQTSDPAETADVTAPQAPGTPTQVAATTTSVTVYWTGSLDDSGTVGYGLYRDNALVATSGGPSFRFAGLACGTAYTFAVDAYDAAGNRSPMSSVGGTTRPCNAHDDTTAPSAPGSVHATATSATSVTLTWTQATDNVGIAGYDVYRDRALVGTTRKTTYMLSGLSCGTSYAFAVAAFDKAENRSDTSSVIVSTQSCPSPPPSPKDTTAPSPPGSPHQTAATSSTVTIGWSASTDEVGVTGYSVLRDGTLLGTTTATSFTVNGLACGTTYALAIEAFDAADNHSPATSVSTATSACADTTPPTAPSSLEVAGTTQTSISVAWKPSNDDVGVSGYGVYRGDDLVGASSVTSYTFSGLSCGTSYALSVDATDAAGNRSGKTSLTAATSACPAPPPPAPDKTAPSAPTGLAKTGSTTTTITVAWDASSDNVAVTGYGLYRDGASAGSTSSLTATFSSLSCGTSYTLAVDATDAAGNRSAKTTLTASTSACPPDTSPPSPVSGLNLTGSTQTTLSVSWLASSDDVAVAGYSMYRNGTKVASTTSLSFTFSGLSCGTTYSLAVEAFDAAGNVSNFLLSTLSAPTGACTVGDTSAPSAPANLRSTASTQTSITVAWDASSDNVVVTGYGLYRDGASAGSTSSLTATFSSLSCGTSYTLAVDATDAAGNRSAKTTLTASTSSCSAPPPAPDTTPPSAPTNLMVTGSTQTSISLSWTASTDNVAVSSYGLYRNDTSTGSATSLTANFTSLSCGTSYLLAVDAADAAGNRSAKTSLTAATSACPAPPPPAPDKTAPSAPTGLRQTGSTPPSISLSWTASTDNVGVTGYNVYRGGTLDGSATSTSYTANALACGSSYTFTVEGKDAAGNVSAKSSSISASTAACATSGGALGTGGWLIRSVDSGASTYTGSAMDDPIVFPFQPGASHMHDFFCNAKTTASSTYLQMVAAPTACPSGDSAGYWAPALYKNGVKINPAGRPTRQQIYYRANNVFATHITPFPADFKMVVGDGHATSLSDASAVNTDSGIGSKIGSEQYWGCSNNSESGKPTEPVNCSTGIISLHLGFPNCWNGVKVAGDQIRAGTMRFPSSGVCPSGFPIVLPRLIERFEYPVGTDSSGITLASGPTYTVHADFWNTWKQSSLEYLVDHCLNAGIDCGTDPSVP